jgi:hypothetical protein
MLPRRGPANLRIERQPCSELFVSQRDRRVRPAGAPRGNEAEGRFPWHPQEVPRSAIECFGRAKVTGNLCSPGFPCAFPNLTKRTLLSENQTETLAAEPWNRQVGFVEASS